jgi:hypothetical protein
MQSNTDVTDAMIEAGGQELCNWEPGQRMADLAVRVFRAMSAARPSLEVQTDGLVEYKPHPTETYWTNGKGSRVYPMSVDDGIRFGEARAADRIAALQRSNAELRSWISRSYAYIDDQRFCNEMSKALSHSSETSND